ncbi:hypothetical protein Q8A73_007879 [Channa argus]|nr:hypothetical protein Q8A73_007879 [Channa argus]
MSSSLTLRRPAMREKMGFIQRERRGRVMKRQPRAGQGWDWKTFQRRLSGPVEADPEYRLIVAANNLTVEIDNELNIIHKFIRDKYSKRFPELESLVPDSFDYIRTVKELGKNLEKCKNNETLQQILTNATIMVVSVTASTTQGSLLTEDELKQLQEACDMALELNQSKHNINENVESRMSFITPNLLIIVGASTAAKIMGIAGGLTNLSKMPACNLMLLLLNTAMITFITGTADRTLQKQSITYIGKSTVRDRSSGTSSSVAFTPLQGLEIMNLQAAEKKVAEANQTYFSNMAEFLKVKKETKM